MTCLLVLDPIFFAFWKQVRARMAEKEEWRSKLRALERHSPGSEGRMDLFSCSYSSYKLSPDFMVWQRTSKREAWLELTVSWQEAAKDRTEQR